MKLKLAGAILAFFAALPAHAVTITFGDSHSPTNLAVTISVADGGGQIIAQQDGWTINMSVAWMMGGMMMTSPNGYRWFSYAEICDPRDTGFQWLMITTGNPIGAIPNPWLIGTPDIFKAEGAPTTSVQIAWSAVVPVPTPDRGSALALFATALGAVFLVRRSAFLVHRTTAA